MTQTKRTMRPFAAALAAASILTLAACDSADNAPVQAESTKETLAEALSSTSNLSTVANALGQTGLAQVFDGAGAYTILAPQDTAFDALGDVGTELRDPQQQAAMAAILRDHVVPGYLTPDDIASAIESKGGSVDVETMGDHILTFSQSGGDIMVTNEDGSSARITGTAVKASNGVAIPLDGVLKKLDTAA